MAKKAGRKRIADLSEKTQTTLRLDPMLYAQLQVLAAYRGAGVNALIEAAISELLHKNKQLLKTIGESKNL